MTIDAMPAWSSPTLGAGLWWLASQPAGLVLNLSILAGSQISSSEIRTVGSCSKWHSSVRHPPQPARLYYTGSLFQLPSSLYHLRVCKKRSSKCSCLENYFPELNCLSESFTKKSKKQPYSIQLCWHGIYQSELDLTQQKVHLHLNQSQKYPKMFRGHLKKAYLQHHKSWGPHWRAYRQSSLLLLPSSSNQGIYLDGEDYSRQTLHTPSENKGRGLALQMKHWIISADFRTHCMHCTSKLAAFTRNSCWEAMAERLKKIKTFGFQGHSGLWSDSIP